MRYEVGDKVVIKDKKRYHDSINKLLKKYNYAFTIKEVDKLQQIYRIEEQPFYMWDEDEIEGTYKEPMYKPIKSRFELLDL